MISDNFDEIAFFARTFPRLLKSQPREPSYVAVGWLSLVNRLLIDLDSLLDDGHAAQFVVHRIDDRMGSLRFDWTLGGETESINCLSPASAVGSVCASNQPSALFVKVGERIHRASLDSASTCLDCSGEATVAKRNGILLAMCDQCANWRRWPRETEDK